MGGVKGENTVRANMDVARDQIIQALSAGLYLAGSNIVTTSIENTPKDLGVLRGSEYCSLPQQTPSKHFVEIGAGGPAASYAVPVHEVDRPHKIGGSKYMERAIHQHQPTVQQDVTRFAQRAMEELGTKTGLPSSTVPTNPWKGPTK